MGIINEIVINMENEIFRGNLLDVGTDNYGIIYNIYKQYNEDSNLEYINGAEEKENIKEGYYDNCILLFSFSNIFFKKNRMSLIRDIYRYLKEGGNVYIWDIDKKLKETFNGKIKILLPGEKVKNISIKDLNLLKDSSIDTTIKLLDPYFEIKDLKSSDGVYYIKGKKKINTNTKEDEKRKEGINESTISSH
ncbi:class I SAM-dependent methyltransferase [Clostridium sporogenes]|uniref:class I SAM-dependent methyltransferase n=1 Tax=Clostridium sporogenes TaxID=1509 RepID=UPI0013C55E77|nr:class I SAM-dependent methyltransferase [Clostridium sporogenes]NFT30438.1 class I SAM-dependent methyltransferase [Clostridium sporogenes]NFT38855.1 class I SAM-dependent methyltransferase [Clostridium sporogenes]NFT54507.1 class I SAM-dependent methyltransferase [Clostridium sporogenes]NFT75480.1 class I SAM-dependent methyltransferase [Clostridium sporogenes]